MTSERRNELLRALNSSSGRLDDVPTLTSVEERELLQAHEGLEKAIALLRVALGVLGIGTCVALILMLVFWAGVNYGACP